MVGAGCTAHVLAILFVNHNSSILTPGLTADFEPALSRTVRALATSAAIPPAILLVWEVTCSTVVQETNYIPLV